MSRSEACWCMLWTGTSCAGRQYSTPQLLPQGGALQPCLVTQCGGWGGGTPGARAAESGLVLHHSCTHRRSSESGPFDLFVLLLAHHGGWTDQGGAGWDEEHAVHPHQGLHSAPQHPGTPPVPLLHGHGDRLGQPARPVCASDGQRWVHAATVWPALWHQGNKVSVLLGLVNIKKRSFLTCCVF